MIMLRSPINRETREVLFRNFCHKLNGDFPDMFFPGRRDRNRGSLRPMPTMARVLDQGCVHVFLQFVQRFRNQGRDWLACLLGKRAEAYDLLAPIYSWFTEDFDTADLQEAKALLAVFCRILMNMGHRL